MRYPKKWQRFAVCLVILGMVSTFFLRPGKAQTVFYIVTDLGSLGGSQSKAYAINNSGRIVGNSNPTVGGLSLNPFALTGGQITNMGTFGGESGTAFAVNEIGYAIGNAATAVNDSHAFIWSDIFNKLDIGALPGGAFASAFDINDSNQVVGQSEIGNLVDRGFVWQKSTGMVAIPPFAGGNASAAYGINNAGQVVGSASTGAATHAYILSGGVMTDIGALGGNVSVAFEIGETGQAVGYSTLPFNSANVPYHAFIYTTATGMTDIGTLGGNRSIAYDVNGSEVVVGQAETAQGINHAFIYDALFGMRDLNDALATSGWTLQEARGINDKGEIVGVGVNPQGETHGFMLTPQIDEIPGGEPPPCFVAPPEQPISVPQQVNMPATPQTGVKKAISPSSSRRYTTAERKLRMEFYSTKGPRGGV